VFTLGYIVYFKFGVGLFGLSEQAVNPDNWWFGISPEGIGSVGMVINIVVCYVVSMLTPPPPQHVQEIIQEIRIPRGAGQAHEH
jgi:cation/acetate symporter